MTLVWNSPNAPFTFTFTQSLFLPSHFCLLKICVYLRYLRSIIESFLSVQIRRIRVNPCADWEGAPLHSSIFNHQSSFIRSPVLRFILIPVPVVLRKVATSGSRNIVPSSFALYPPGPLSPKRRILGERGDAFPIIDKVGEGVLLPLSFFNHHSSFFFPLGRSGRGFPFAIRFAEGERRFCGSTEKTNFEY